jgi:hypothetical protein
MKKFVCAAFLAAVVLAGGRLAAEDKPKYEIAVVMEKAHKGGQNSLRAKILGGKASKEDLDMLVDLYTALGQNTPPKGDKEAWKKKTATVLAAAKKVKENPTDRAGLQALNRATMCMACHNEFKGDE